ncbi:dimethylarginine dimethylaminohydrolase family protein [Francisella adeliensis]|uniref:Amidinotransferase n=1 Tax=Francisella adeliensis TaxID=2007306 RepID=A0A2Z4XZZ5_9GAMM|nr:arginine deiminase-related protein [Francisella adeliensis]AXA33945.1 amidinotransferase [Francisella adeliensis]MBK2085853.1 amidinotransferase [Francisella adeliensis]MBK2097731.1 amidinotransferase [Francisella adeliensis]QIW12181.1 amidinotransferase [Francisella adeliensis]QIW14057.1 amidinotransferase [Francisella adeliensis]
MKKVLMCPPTAFDVTYAINPWMDISNKPNKKLAYEQWQRLYDTYINLGIEVYTIEQDKNLPDMVFTANAGIVENNTFICSNFAPPERKPEEDLFQKWFFENNYNVKTLKNHQSGEGDALYYNDKMYCGYGYRSDLKAYDEISEIIDTEIVPLKIVDPYFYDLDLLFCPLGNRGCLSYLNGFAQESQDIIGVLPNNIILSPYEVKKHLCNSVYVDGKLIMNSCNDQLRKKLFKLDIEPIIIDISEFGKAGGGLKCLTLKLE